MTGQYDLTVTEVELDELNGFVNLLDCSDGLKRKVTHLYGYAKLMSKAKYVKSIYDRAVARSKAEESGKKRKVDTTSYDE